VNGLLMTVTRHRHSCDLNPGPTVPTAPKSSTLTTRLPSHPMWRVCVCVCIQLRVRVVFLLDHMLSTSEDDTKALTHIVKVWLSVWLTRNTAIGINCAFS